MLSSILILLERVNAYESYEEFMIILTTDLLLIAILNYKK